MNNDKYEQLKEMGYDRLRIPMLYLINITYGIFENSRKDKDKKSDKDLVREYNTLFNKIILDPNRQHKPKFVFSVGDSIYSMILNHIKLTEVVPINNMNILQQYNYNVHGTIDMDLFDEESINDRVYKWYKNKRDNLNSVVEMEVPKGTILDEFGGITDIMPELAKDVTTEDYCVFSNILETFPIIEDFIMDALIENSEFPIMGKILDHYFLKQEDIVWASMLFNDSAARIADGFRTYDEENDEYRITTLKVCADFHTTTIDDFDDEKVVVIEKDVQPTYICLVVGVFTISDNKV